MAWKYLCGRRLASALTVCSVALGVSLVLATLLLTRGIREGFVTGTTDYNLLVGAKGQRHAARAQYHLSPRYRTLPNIAATVHDHAAQRCPG